VWTTRVVVLDEPKKKRPVPRHAAPRSDATGEANARSGNVEATGFLRAAVSSSDPRPRILRILVPVNIHPSARLRKEEGEIGTEVGHVS
jgi:hypothetical protein